MDIHYIRLYLIQADITRKQYKANKYIYIIIIILTYIYYIYNIKTATAKHFDSRRLIKTHLLNLICLPFHRIRIGPFKLFLFVSLLDNWEVMPDILVRNDPSLSMVIRNPNRSYWQLMDNNAKKFPNWQWYYPAMIKRKGIGRATTSEETSKVRMEVSMEFERLAETSEAWFRDSISGWVLMGNGLFFPSNASWLSPGRSTLSIACCSDEWIS